MTDVPMRPGDDEREAFDDAEALEPDVEDAPMEPLVDADVADVLEQRREVPVDDERRS